ncbi:MAG: hypothetical protein R3D05_06245 [Dongiaceae bacterium]
MTTIDAFVSTHDRNHTLRQSTHAWTTRAMAWLIQATDAVLDWQDRTRQRRQLLALGDRDLQDFGTDRCAAAREGDKAFWQS